MSHHGIRWICLQLSCLIYISDSLCYPLISGAIFICSLYLKCGVAKNSISSAGLTLNNGWYYSQAGLTLTSESPERCSSPRPVATKIACFYEVGKNDHLKCDHDCSSLLTHQPDCIVSEISFCFVNLPENHPCRANLSLDSQIEGTQQWILEPWWAYWKFMEGNMAFAVEKLWFFSNKLKGMDSDLKFTGFVTRISPCYRATFYYPFIRIKSWYTNKTYCWWFRNPIKNHLGCKRKR